MKVNTNKILMERIGAIVSIVFGALLLIGSIYLLSEINNYDSGNYYYEGDLSYLRFITIMIIVVSIVMIVLSIMILPKPVNDGNGFIKERKGRIIALCIIEGILALLEFIGNGPIYGLLMLAAVVLLIVSLCMKHIPDEEIEEVRIPGVKYKDNATFDDNVVKEEPKKPTLSEEISQLKSLLDNGTITEEQYKDGVDKLISK